MSKPKKTSVLSKKQDQGQPKQQVAKDKAPMATMVRSNPSFTPATQVVETAIQAASKVWAEVSSSAPSRRPISGRPISLEAGRIIADLYRVEEEIMGGAMGTIHRVRHLQWDIDLIVKTPNEQTLQAAGGRQRFQEREALEWVRLGLHPNIASCFYVRTLDDGIPRIFIEYVSGGNLFDWLVQNKIRAKFKLAGLATALDIGIQICWGVAWAHRAGLVHRDIKPGNILMTPNGTPKVTDFGLVKPTTEEREYDTGQVVTTRALGKTSFIGTPGYAAPEQRGSGMPITSAADVYALGVVLYELLQQPLGWPAFPHAHPEARPTLYHIELEQRDDALSSILLRCMADNPKERYLNAIQLAKTLIETYQAIVGTAYSRQTPNEVQSLADGLNNQAISLIDLNRADAAERLLDQALKADPSHPEAIYNHGLLRWQSGRMTDEELLGNLREAQKSQSKTWLYSYLIGLVHVGRGDKTEAVSALKTSIETSGGDTQVKQAFQKAQGGLYQWGKHLKTFEGHTGYVTSVAISPDGQVALSGGGGGGWRGYAVQLWDLTSGKCLKILGEHDDDVTSVAISPDGRLGLSGSKDSSLRLWDLVNGERLSIIWADSIASVVISHDGRLGLSGGGSMKENGYTVRLWDLASGKCLHTFKGHTGQVTSVAISPDNQFALSGSQDKTLWLWNLENKEFLKTFKGHSDDVTCVAISPDGRLGLSGSYDRTLRLWDLQSGQCQKIFEGHVGPVTSIAISSDGEFVLSGSWDGALRLWRLQSGQCLRTFKGHTGYANSVAISPDGQFALSGGADKTLRLWELVTGNHIPYVLVFPQGFREVNESSSRFQSFMEDARRAMETGHSKEAYLAVEKARQVPGYERVPEALDLSLQIGQRGIRTGLRSSWLVRMIDGDADTTSVAISADGRLGFSSGSEGILYSWDLRSGQVLQTFKGHESRTISVAISSDGELGLSGSYDWDIRLWHFPTGQCLKTLNGHSSAVTSVAISPNGQLGLSGSGDKTVRLWDLDSEQCLHIFKGHTSAVTSVAISPDDRLGLSGSYDKTLRLWDLQSGQYIRTFKGHTNRVTCVAISPDGQLGFSGSNDNTLRLWHLRSGKHLRIFEGHTDPVTSVAIFPDSQFGLSGSNDGTLRVWDLRNGRCLRTLEGHTEGVGTVDISSDGRYGLSGGKNKSMRLWEFDWLYNFPLLTDWDEGAQLYLEIFLTRHTPDATHNKNRIGRPTWTEDDFQQLLSELGSRGYGWLQKEGVRQRLKEMATSRLGALFLLAETRTTPKSEQRSGGRGVRTGLQAGWTVWSVKEHSGGVTSVAISPDGRFGLSGGGREDNTLRLWSLDHGVCLRILKGHTDYVTSVAISPDGRLGLSGSGDKTLRLWDLGQGQCLQFFKGHTDEVTSVAISPDGRLGLSGGGDKTLRLWDLGRGQPLRTFEGHTDLVHAVAISPNGRFVLSGGNDKTLRLWNLYNGQHVRIFKGHTGSVHAVAISPDGRLGLSGSEDMTLKLWDLQSGQCLRTFEEHKSRVYSVAISPDGRQGLSGSGDMTLKLWDLQSGHCLQTFTGHTSFVSFVTISPNGQLGLSGSNDQTLRLWKFDWLYDFPPPADWDEGARPYLEIFLTLHTPAPTSFQRFVGRINSPSWTEEDFQGLLTELGYRGYGWLRPEGVQRELEKMASSWQSGLWIHDM